MTDRELIDAFTAWRDDIDSEPFAHQAEMDSAVAAFTPVTPAGGAGCPVVLTAATAALLLAIAVVYALVQAVM